MMSLCSSITINNEINRIKSLRRLFSDLHDFIWLRIFQIIIFIIFTMPNKRAIKKKNSTNPAIEPTFNITSFNDLTNIHLLLQQQQNQLEALSKAATQQ